MQPIGGAPAFSATDLNNFLACEHLTTLDLNVLHNGGARPNGRSEQAEILSRLGQQHEDAYLARLRAEGLIVTSIVRENGLDAAAAATLAAMEARAQVIYQATFFDGTWLGHADFLRRVDVALPGARWDWHYEVEDTKLARHTEPYFLLQLCYYSEHVERVQGAAPAMMYVVLGDGTRHAFRHDDYAAYYRAVKERFIERLHDDATATYPQPVAHCNLCVWNDVCTAQRRRDDHLSQVANISRVQTARLNAAGILTLEALGTATAEQRPPRIAASTFETIARQARLQLAQRRAEASGVSEPVPPELLPIAAPRQARGDNGAQDDIARGFALLPVPSPGDMFFDMEGDPYYEIGRGLEYLFGVYTPNDGEFRAFWGCDRSAHPLHDRFAEKAAFEAFIDLVMERWKQFPEMHVYHYASYEKSALQRLAEAHATREDEVDKILRGQLLVDLYRVVRQSIVVGQPSYSIKRLEVYYQKRKDVAIKAGDESILRFEEWLTTRRDPALRSDAILHDLENYNKEDCISTYHLRQWLLQLREQAIAQFKTEIPFHAGPGEIEEPAAKTNDKYLQLKALLVAQIPPLFDIEEPAWQSSDAMVYWMALQMLEYHYREDRPVYWRFHDRCETYADDPQALLDDAEAIVGLEPVGPPVPEKKSLVHTLRFPLQQLKLGEIEAWDPATKEKTGDIIRIGEDGDGGILELKRGPSRTGPPPDAIIARGIVPAGPIRDALARFATVLLDRVPPRHLRAAYDILLKRTPRLRDRAAGAVLQPEVPDEAAIQSVVDALDESYLFLQGPPGSGKTYIGARLIVTLLQRGYNVGVTANSHKAIHNLLREVEAVAIERNVIFSGQKQGSSKSDEGEYTSLHQLIRTVPKFDPNAGARLFAGTAWAFSAEHMCAQLDYLFIDEAGQVSLPNSLAVATSAKNVVLLGDPLQLPQVSHTSHPGGLGASVLSHLLDGEERTVAPERGILLTTTYRMHSDVCRFISTMMYEGRLAAAPQCDLQRVTSEKLDGVGVRWLPVEHENNRQDSREEAERIADEIEILLRGTVTDCDGAMRMLLPSDIIVVTPYNAQVHRIRKVLAHRPACSGVEVGTVDKFQGQEAYVVFFSTAASSAEDAPRGVDFIFDRNRFNVAISRARALAVLVGSPRLLYAQCGSIKQVRALNAVFQFVELARPAAVY